MKGLLIALSTLLLVACADFRTLEELEFAALQSGDWSAVDRREKNIARREAQRGIQCPAGKIPVCDQRGQRTSCNCTSRDGIEDLLGGY